MAELSCQQKKCGQTETRKENLPKKPRREKMRAGNLDNNQASSSKTFLRDFTIKIGRS